MAEKKYNLRPKQYFVNKIKILENQSTHKDENGHTVETINACPFDAHCHLIQAFCKNVPIFREELYRSVGEYCGFIKQLDEDKGWRLTKNEIYKRRAKLLVKFGAKVTKEGHKTTIDGAMHFCNLHVLICRDSPVLNSIRERHLCNRCNEIIYERARPFFPIGNSVAKICPICQSSSKVLQQPRSLVLFDIETDRNGENRISEFTAAEYYDIINDKYEQIAVIEYTDEYDGGHYRTYIKQGDHVGVYDDLEKDVQKRAGPFDQIAIAFGCVKK